MSKIRILTPDVSNKIAAGEVVENPASVVKELIENAIDAGASSIIVEIKNGGVSYIRVTDNGSGMESGDAKTAFMRHATSKINSALDLESIETLGFRGEALASVAAVSNIELMTKIASCEGFHLELSAGELINEQEVGCPDGTTIVIKDLFFNTPARMKFLKSDKTETSHVTDIVERLVLGNSDISLKYIVDGKERLFFGGDGQLKSCVYSVYGRDYAKGCVEIERNQNNIHTTGVAGKAEVSRGNRSFQSFFLNGRYVKNRSLTYAAEAAYKNVLMSGKFPFFIVYLNVPYQSVDINVHPTKQEVKFANERAVCDEVYWAIKSALQCSADDIRREIATPIKNSFASPVFSEPHTQLHAPIPQQSIDMIKANVAAMTQPNVEIQAPQKNYRIVGQFFGTYIIIELDDKIILIDQHAAHERMIYERLLKANKEKQLMMQMLLSPVAITLSPKEYSILIENLQFFCDLGFEVEEFGNNSILIRQTPTDVGEDELKSLVTELIAKVEKSNGSLTDSQADMLEMISCKAAIKGNSKLHESEITALVDDVIRTNGVNTCPHGRPLMVTITKHELEKMFKRIV